MIRKIIKIGNSDGITIPVRMMRAYKLKAGDKVRVELQTSVGSPTDQEVLQRAAVILKRLDHDLKKRTRKQR